MRRGIGPLFWILLLLATLTALAWLTRHPEAEVLRRAERWPVVGSLAARFRQAYQPRAVPERATASGTTADAVEDDDLEVVVLMRTPEDLEPRPYLWVEPGTPIYSEPDPKSDVIESVRSLSNLSMLEQRGDWYRIRKPQPGKRPLRGWVFLEDYQEPSQEALRQPDPVLPLVAAPPDPERVEAARALMKAGGSESRCGPHPLFTDAASNDLTSICPALVAALERTYRQRYGIEPVSPPAEAILLFQRRQAYQTFRAREAVGFESVLAHAIPARGYVALFLGQRDSRAVVTTLIHELTHLLNRRALGPALPPWLTEGIADDLAESRIDADGSIHPGELGGDSRSDGSKVVWRGGVAAAVVLQAAVNRDELPTLAHLMSLDRQQFNRDDRAQLHYAVASFWIRYLLSGFDETLTQGFRAFLKDVAAGAPLSEDLLLNRLGRGWDELELGFRVWVRLQYLRPVSESREQLQSGGPDGRR